MKRLLHWLVTTQIRLVLSLLCRVDARELSKLPRSGPYMIIVNHVNFLEVPIIYAWLQPRIIHSLVKEETWKNPFLGFLANTWHAIPLKRGSADFKAFSAAAKLFQNNGILIMAPEGTRTGTGILKKAHGGAAFLAWHNQIPVYPLVHTGGEKFFTNLRRLRRTAFSFRVGQAFRLAHSDTTQLDGKLRQQYTEAMMGQLALLLPPAQRGAYSEAAMQPSAELLNFTDGQNSHG